VKGSTEVFGEPLLDEFGLNKECIFVSPLITLMIVSIFLEGVEEEIILFYFIMGSLLVSKYLKIAAVRWVNLSSVRIIGDDTKIFLLNLFWFFEE
jgi:hypothetical protein